MRERKSLTPTCNCKSKPFKLGFTLTEVLITLGIIGIVAQMTIPTLYQNTQKQVLKTQFQKMYSVINQAFTNTKLSLGVDNAYGTYVNWNGTEYVNSQKFIDEFYKQLKIMGTQSYSTPPMNYNKTTNAGFLGNVTPPFMLPDGSSIECIINASRINISFDSNGPSKKPNRTGYDIFNLQVENSDTVKPCAPADWPTYFICDKTSTSQYNGLGCSYYALIDQNPDDSTKRYWDSLQ